MSTLYVMMETPAEAWHLWLGVFGLARSLLRNHEVVNHAMLETVGQKFMSGSWLVLDPQSKAAGRACILM
jgi:hypothetical protein